MNFKIVAIEKFVTRKTVLQEHVSLMIAIIGKSLLIDQQLFTLHFDDFNQKSKSKGGNGFLCVASLLTIRVSEENYLHGAGVVWPWSLHS